MIRSIVLLAAVSALASLPVIGIGCGGKASGTAADGGATDSGTDALHHVDAGGTDAGGDDGGGLPEGGVGPHGVQLVQSANVVINGVTSDGYAVYTDTSANTFNAVSLAGGMPTALGNSDGTAESAKGPVAFSFNGVDQTTGGGTLAIWTSAHGQKTVGTAVLLSNVSQGQLDLSADGTHVLYIDNVTASTGDVSVIDADGTNKKVLVPGADLTNQNCPPILFFAGAYAVVEGCPAGGDAGAASGDAGVTSNATIQTFTGAGWTTTATIASAATGSFGFGVDPTGANIIYASASGLQAAAVATGTSAVLDAQGTTGLFTNDGKHVVYVVGGAVNLVASTGGSPTPLLAAGGYSGIGGISPDNNWLLAYKTTTQDMLGDTLSDLYLASATKSSSPTTLASSATAALFGDAFTADSSHAVYTASVTSGTGTLTSAATSGGTPAALGSTIWINTASTGAKVVFNTNYVSGGGGGSNGQADIVWADTSASTPASLLVTQADAIYYLDQAKDKVVYSWSYLTDGTAGIWVTPLP